jgi:hypothetical protein
MPGVYRCLQCGVPDGGLVPKSLYQEDLLDRSPDEPSTLSPNSLYQTAHVVREFPNEVIFFHSLVVVLLDANSYAGAGVMTVSKIFV